MTFVLTIGMFGGMLLLPLFLQNLRGLGAAETGLILIFQVLPMTIAMPLVGRLVDKVGARAVILTGLPLLALTTWQFGRLDLTTTDVTIRFWLAARGCAMGLVMMPSMTAGLNAVPMPLMSRASSMSNVMRQVFGAFGTAIVVTMLQQRQTFHTAMLAQTVTPENLPLQQLMAHAQQWGISQGLTAAQAQMMGMMAGRPPGLDRRRGDGLRRRLPLHGRDHPAGDHPGAVHENDEIARRQRPNNRRRLASAGATPRDSNSQPLPSEGSALSVELGGRVLAILARGRRWRRGGRAGRPSRRSGRPARPGRSPGRSAR